MVAEGKDILQALAEEVARLRAVARENEDKARVLEQTLTRLAKGTEQVVPAGGSEVPSAPRRGRASATRSTAPAPTPRMTEGNGLDDLSHRIRAALSRESLTTAQLAKAVHESADALEGRLHKLNFEGHVHNLDLTGKKPIWTWRIGNNTDNRTLYAELKRLLSERPLRRRDLVEATGADEKRIDNQLVELRRKEFVWMPNKGETDHWGTMFQIQEGAPPAKFDGRLSMPAGRGGRTRSR